MTALDGDALMNGRLSKYLQNNGLKKPDTPTRLEFGILQSLDRRFRPNTCTNTTDSLRIES